LVSPASVPQQIKRSSLQARDWAQAFQKRHFEPLFAIVLAIVVLAIVVLAIVVLAIVVPLFCVLGSVASYRRARHRRAMLSPSELVSASSPSYRCLVC